MILQEDKSNTAADRDCGRQGQKGESVGRHHSRREFLRNTGLLAAATALAAMPGSRWLAAACAEPADSADPLRDTLKGLTAFVVPGPDPFSTHQRVSTPEPGGVDANITEVLILALDQLVPFLPNFSQVVAGILNQVAQAVDPSASGPFASPFANLSFAKKATVFAFMEGNPELLGLASGLLQFVGFLAYSEAGVIDPTTGTLTGTPLGWTLSGYEGIADGRDEFKGYYQNRRRVS